MSFRTEVSGFSVGILLFLGLYCSVKALIPDQLQAEQEERMLERQRFVAEIGQATDRLEAIGAEPGDFILCTSERSSRIYIVCKPSNLRGHTDRPHSPSRVSDGSLSVLWKGNCSDVVKKDREPERYAKLMEEFVRQAENSE